MLSQYYYYQSQPTLATPIPGFKTVENIFFDSQIENKKDWCRHYPTLLPSTGVSCTEIKRVIPVKVDSVCFQADCIRYDFGNAQRKKCGGLYTCI